MFLLGGLCFIGGMLFANHIIPGSNKPRKSNEEEYDETHEDNGKIVRILDHCFTVRIHYFQKRIDTTDFSYPVP